MSTLHKVKAYFGMAPMDDYEDDYYEDDERGSARGYRRPREDRFEDDGYTRGYDTYAFEAGATPEDVVRRMTARFREVFTPDLAQAARERGLTVDQAVTLASLIEKEAAVADERPVISAVFHNRLARRMPLQSDPTVLYGVAGSDGRIRSADLARATPYNTYVIPGLPPGPIANPGRASIVAAVRPAPGVTALYFVARNDRTHEFNDTLAAHQRAVNRWQRRARPAPRPAGVVR